MSTQDKTLATTEKQNILANVRKQIEAANQRGLSFPADFNLANAMASAKIALVNQGIIDVNGNPVANACKLPSLVNAVYDMCVQGLDVGKKQGYFINYGGVLTFQRSYFGDIALAKRVKPNIEVYGDVILEGEKFVPKKIHTRFGLITVVHEHIPAWPVRDMTKIVGCYVGSTYTNPKTGEIEDMGIELMTMDQIKQGWKKSKTYKPGGNTFHNEQPDQACLRSTSRRWSKPIINESTDEFLRESVQRQEILTVEAEVDADAEINANGQPLSLPQQAEDRIGQPPTQEAEPVTATTHDNGARSVDEATGEVTGEGGGPGF